MGLAGFVAAEPEAKEMKRCPVDKLNVLLVFSVRISVAGRCRGQRIVSDPWW